MLKTSSIAEFSEDDGSELHTFVCDEGGVRRWFRQRSREDCTEDVQNDYPNDGVKLVHVRVNNGWDLLEEDGTATLRNKPSAFDSAGVCQIMLNDPKAIYVCLGSVTEQARAERATALLTQLLALGVGEIAATEITFRLTVVSVTERECARQARELITPRTQNATAPVALPFT